MFQMCHIERREAMYNKILLIASSFFVPIQFQKVNYYQAFSWFYNVCRCTCDGHADNFTHRTFYVGLIEAEKPGQ